MAPAPKTSTFKRSDVLILDMDDCNAASIMRTARFILQEDLELKDSQHKCRGTELVGIFPVEVIVDPVNCPAVLVGIIH